MWPCTNFNPEMERFIINTFYAASAIGVPALLAGVEIKHKPLRKCINFIMHLGWW